MLFVFRTHLIGNLLVPGIHDVFQPLLEILVVESVFRQVLLRNVQAGLSLPLETLVSSYAHEPLQMEQEFTFVIRLQGVECTELRDVLVLHYEFH